MTGFYIEYSKDSSFATFLTLDVSGGSARNGTLTNLDAGTAYYFRVSAHTTSTTSQRSTPGTATTDAASAGSKLTGTAMGTAGSWNGSGNTYDKALDGNAGTFFDAPTANNNYVGLSLASPTRLTSARVYPRAGFAWRVTGAKIQGSNDNVNWTDLATVTSEPDEGTYTTLPINDSGTYLYVRYLSPNDGYGNIAEVEFYGTTTTSSNYTAVATGGSTGSFAPTVDGYAITSNGYGVTTGSQPDQVEFVYDSNAPQTGTFDLMSRIDFGSYAPGNVPPRQTAGLMARVNPSDGQSLNFYVRVASGAARYSTRTESTTGYSAWDQVPTLSSQSPNWIRLRRDVDPSTGAATYYGYVGYEQTDGTVWWELVKMMSTSSTSALAGGVYVGMAVAADDVGTSVPNAIGNPATVAMSAPAPVVGPQVLVLVGDNVGADQWYVRRNSSVAIPTVQVWRANNTSGPVFQSELASAVSAIHIFGQGGNDALTVDFSNGSPVPAGPSGFTFDGGDDSDSILIIGSAGDAATVGEVNVESRTTTP